MSFNKGQEVIVYTTKGWAKGEIHEIHKTTGYITVAVYPILFGKKLRRTYPREAYPKQGLPYRYVTIAEKFIRESPFKNDGVS